MNVLHRLALGILAAGFVVASAAAADESFFTHLHTEKAMANVTVSPARVGPVEITIQLETMDEKPLSAKAVSVTLAMAGAKPAPVAAERQSDDTWLARLSVPRAGQWMLGLGIAISDSDKVNIEAPVVIK